MYHSVIPYVYADSSYRSLSEGLLHLVHGYRFPPALLIGAWVFVGGRGRACCSRLLEGVEVFFLRMCKIWCLSCL